LKYKKVYESLYVSSYSHHPFQAEFQTLPKKLIGDVDADGGFTGSVFGCRIGAMV